MKIPQTAKIYEDKFTKYLLIKREFDDKSKFLQSVGFKLEKYYILIEELKNLIGHEEAVKENMYGIFYSVTGSLSGPSGKKLHVVTIWMYKNEDEEYHFITLRPVKG
jgi:hypothetical protein